jgi:hypothetical protein
MMCIQKKGRVLRLSLLLSLLLAVGLAMGGRAPSRANAASPAPPADWVTTPVGYDSQQFGSKQYAYGAYYNNSVYIEHLEELYTQPDGWHYADLTVLTGAPPLYSVTRIAGYDSPQFRSKQYAYVDSSDHVQELYYARVNGFWRWNDLTALTGAPLVKHNEEESLIGFDSPQFGSKEYAYVAQNGHIIELAYWGNSWHVNDLTALTGAPSPVGVMTLVGFDSPQYGSRQYAYLDSKYHLEEIYCRTNGCAVADLTAFTGAPAAFPYTERTVSGFDSPQFGSKQYAYIDKNFHLQELFYARANGYWSANDLTTLYQAPEPNLQFGMTGFASPQFGSKQYGYIDGQYHIDEVSYWSGTWHTTDLTALANANADGQAEEVLGFASPQFGSRQYGYIDTWTLDFEETYFVAGTWHTVDLTQIAHP